MTHTTRSAPLASRRFLSTNTYSLEGYYHIEASNALQAEDVDEDGHLQVVYATKLTVTGPDVDGILASMTVALAVKGCSLVSLHAAKSQDMGHRADITSRNIKDVFYVVDRFTGQPFQDEQLPELAESLLEALKQPMTIVGMEASNSNNTVQTVLQERPTPPYPTRSEQITIIPSSGSSNIGSATAAK